MKQGLSIVEAICNLSTKLNLAEHEKITAIQCEDGSKLKFNYQINSGEWQFMDLSDMERYFIISGINGICLTKEEFEQDRLKINLIHSKSISYEHHQCICSNRDHLVFHHSYWSL